MILMDHLSSLPYCWFATSERTDRRCRQPCGRIILNEAIRSPASAMRSRSVPLPKTGQIPYTSLCRVQAMLSYVALSRALTEWSTWHTLTGTRSTAATRRRSAVTWLPSKQVPCQRCRVTPAQDDHDPAALSRPDCAIAAHRASPRRNCGPAGRARMHSVDRWRTSIAASRTPVLPP